VSIIGHKSKDRPVLIQVAIRLIDQETGQPFGDIMFLPMEKFLQLLGTSGYVAKAHEEKRKLVLIVDRLKGE